ncbi:MAG TPA: NBR1-Ig-like domain-containing protein [Anaerolineae bacterium]|nr:NBR1-Ig-like domain-containing protein [Anaerolineae bacterium]HQH38562.1 NBR1-Ig-like domain-containing protein [Anaerolineae bacterium]
MSDENQPNEVVESQLKPETVIVEPPPPFAPEAMEPPEVSPLESVQTEAMPMETPVEAESYLDMEAGMETPAATEVAPSIVSIAELEASKPSTGEKINAFLTGAGAFFRGRRWLLGALAGVVLMVIVALLVPKLSLAQLGSDYTTLDAKNLTVEHPDGLKVRLVEPAENKVRVKLESVPRADFVAGSLSEDLLPALTMLPTYLTPKSPYYKITMRNKDVSGLAQLEVVIPNEAEPWETLDLYAWDGDTWRWLPTKLDRTAEVLTADVKTLPASVMVMQTSMTEQKIATEAETFPLPATLTPSPETVLTEVDVPGILVGTMGGVTGDATQLPPAHNGALTLVPLVRNWAPGRDPNWALVSDMLNNVTDRNAHVQNLLGVAQSGGYSGLVLDYRHLPAADRDAYASFVTDLGKALQQNGLWLAVVVDAPQRTADGAWDTGGYDWATLGAAADQLRVVMPLEPGAYAPGGLVEQMIVWGVTQVNRYKLLPIYTTLSTDGEKTLALNTILEPIGSVQAVSPLTASVTPGTALSFKLGAISTVETDVATGATRLVVGETSLWLGTPQWLRVRLDLITRYHLGGVVLRELTDAGNLPGILDAIAAYKAQTAPAEYALPEIVWQVTGPDGQTATKSSTALTQPQFAWTAPAITGTYTIAATVAGVEKGSLAVLVAVPTPVITATVAETETIGGGTTATTLTPAETPTTELKVGFIADVTVPDNTHFQKGEKFTKTWRMKNIGSKDWPKDTVLVFVSGEPMTEVTQVEIGEVKAGENVDISVDMVAPNADGTYKGNWQIQAGDKVFEGVKPYVVIQVGEQPVATPVPTPVTPIVAPVLSGSFELGGHVRDAGLPYKDLMHYAGMNWMKVQVQFGQGAGDLINIAHANGFKIQLSALGGPTMVTQAGFEDKFASWVAGLASAGADAIEVWNEPNIDREWQIGLISPQAYVNLLCKAYNAIKGANGGTAVISAAPAPTGWFGGCSANGCDDQPWLEGLYNAGAANCMDYIGAHHNAGATSPSATSGHPGDNGGRHHSWYFLPQTQLYYNIFRGTRKLFYTEMGYASQDGVPTFSDQFAWARGTNNAQQAAWLAEAASLGASTGMVRCIIVWNIDFVRYGYDPQDGYAIIRPGGGCPACETLHAILGTR